MIKSGDENPPNQQESEAECEKAKLDQACRPTGWVHVEKDIDLTDPKVSKINFFTYCLSSLRLIKILFHT